ncbi:sensor histidine kinase [Rhodococcus sp. (in: high G+C Gram-positive bacteria)]|uniref:sensor histidine kinase n=1 Tax=Rhodococcus sp. TaxID=1831 RepID=UPI0038907961
MARPSSSAGQELPPTAPIPLPPDGQRASFSASLGLAPALLFTLGVLLAAGSVLLAHADSILLSDVVTAGAVVALIGGIALLVRARGRDLVANARLRALAARRADQVSMLSHEIRTPLAVIQGSAELLAEHAPGPLLPRQEVFVRRIVDNASRMSALAEQLLMQARLESDTFEVNPRTVDLRALMRSVVQDLGPVAGVPIVLQTPGAPVHAHVDAELIRQVMNNLIMNAARSDPGTSAIDVRVTSGEDHVLVAVSDGGTGMTEVQRDRLFRRFQSGRPLGNGTGIGLFISQQLVQLHGGRIFVDTITGKGTTMMFTLPAGGPRG